MKVRFGRFPTVAMEVMRDPRLSSLHFAPSIVNESQRVEHGMRTHCDGVPTVPSFGLGDKPWFNFPNSTAQSMGSE